MHIFHQLRLVDLRVNFAVFHQFLVRAARRDRAFIQHQNLIGVEHRADALRDHKTRAALHQPIERLLNLVLRHQIDTARRIVEDQDVRIEQQGARDGDALLLPAR